MFDLKDNFEEVENVALGDPSVMPIDHVALIKIMADSPVAAAKFYKTLFEVQEIFFFQDLGNLSNLRNEKHNLRKT
jgi:hypothetical protein